MSRQFDADALMALVPLIYRSRDAQLVERTEKGPLQSLIELFAEQIGVLEESFDQAYDDLFIETCAPWLVPYIGDVIGYVPLPGTASLSERAQVAHLIAYRRRKGTLAMLHQAVRDTTGWGVHVVEYFRRVAGSESMSRTVSSPAYVDVRQTLDVTPTDAVFTATRKTVDVRNIAAGSGEYGLTNVGVHLWRLRSYPLTDVPAPQAAGHDGRAFRFHPLGVDTQLFTRVADEPPFASAGIPQGIALPISRERLTRELRDLYAPAGSLYIIAGGRAVTPDEIVVRSLAGATPGAWSAAPSDRYCVDPKLGRLMVPHRKHPIDSVRVSFCYGSSADIGGGPYDREATLRDTTAAVTRFVREGSAALASSLQSLTLDTLVELTSSARFDALPVIEIGAGVHLTLRAADGVWPTFASDTPLRVIGRHDSRLTLSGIAMAIGGLSLEGEIDEVRIVDCTIVPPDPRHDRTAVRIDGAVRRVILERCVSGPIVAQADVELDIRNSIVDAGSRARMAIASERSFAGPLSLRESTVIGNIEVLTLAEASNSLCAGTVRSQRFAAGCARYSYFAPGSIVPQRFLCLPRTEHESPLVHFTSRHYGAPGYLQLAAQTAHSIRHGADDGNELGAYHATSTAGREAALHAILGDALPLAMQVGIRYLT